MDTVIPDAKCSACGYKMDRSTAAFGEAQPNEGDLSMCLNCGHVSIFDKQLRLRQPTPGEKAIIDADPRLIHAQLARSYVVNKDLTK
jgi:hypothetical protein